LLHLKRLAGFAVPTAVWPPACLPPERPLSLTALGATRKEEIMSRTTAVSLFALAALIPFAAGCDRSDRAETTSASEGANTPVVSASSTDTGSAVTATTPAEAKTVTYEQAESVYGSGNYSEAVQQFSLYTESRPENPWGHYMLGMSAWKGGEPDRALSAFDRSLELDPTHRKSLFNSSRVLLEGGRNQEALERIEQALGQEPMSNEGLRLLGRARYQLGQVDQAIEAYQRALSVDEQDVWSMNNLGLIYIDQDRSTEALPPLARAVQLRSTAPVFQNNLGVALERSGYPVAAAKAYEAAIAADSSYQKASVALARVTSGEQQAEVEPVDLDSLAQRFVSDVQGWRDSAPTVAEVQDSTGETVQPAGDSTTSSIEVRNDSLESCECGE
jgi:tetratricopeptide (TPR) repeat protein